MASMFITEGPATGQTLALEDHPLILIGRDANCTFQILDEQVSRRHLQIKRDDQGHHAVVDCSSANGVHVNGKLIDGDLALKGGDVVKIGATSMIYSTANLPDAQTAADAWFKKGQGQQKTMLPPTEE